MIRGGDALVKAADEVTRRLAEGYTLGGGPGATKKFADAAAGLQSYITAARQLEQRGCMPAETATLLVEQATTLRQLVDALVSPTPSIR